VVWAKLGARLLARGPRPPQGRARSAYPAHQRLQGHGGDPPRSRIRGARRGPLQLDLDAQRPAVRPGVR